MKFNSASGAVNSDLIPNRVKPMAVKLVFTVSPLDVQNQKNSVEYKPANLPVAPLGKALIAGFPYLGVVDKWPATPKRVIKL